MNNLSVSCEKTDVCKQMNFCNKFYTNTFMFTKNVFSLINNNWDIRSGVSIKLIWKSF